MTLRLRRGTDAERESVVFAEGELIYTTDTKELYVGDGTTPGGILVSQSEETPVGGLNSLEDDANPQLGGNLNLNNFEINGIGDIDINGTVSANIISGDLFVGDGSGLTNLPLPEGEGVVEGSNYRINIIGDDSSIIVDAANNLVTATDVATVNLTTLNLSSVIVRDRDEQNTDPQIIQILSNDSRGSLKFTRKSENDISNNPSIEYGGIIFERDDTNGPQATSLILGTENALFFANNPAGTFATEEYYVVWRDNKFGIQKLNPEKTLDVNGDAIIRGNLTIENGSLILDALDFELLDPERGLLVYDSDTDLLKLYDGEDWLSIISANPNNIAIFPGPIVIGPVSQNDIDEFGDDSSVVTGALIYNDTEDRFQFFQAGSWVSLPNNGSEIGQILAWNGSEWAAADPAVASGTVENADLLNGFSGSFYLDYNNFTNTPTIPSDLTDLGIVDGTTGQVLTTDGSGNFSFSTISSGVNSFDQLTDVSNADLTINQMYLQSVTRLKVTNSGASAYLFDQYTGNNPTLRAISGTTIAFDLDVLGHPFLIQDEAGNNFDTGLVHVSVNGTVTTGSSAQGQTSGTLYWKIPNNISGSYRYICSIHGSMVGEIEIADSALQPSDLGTFNFSGSVISTDDSSAISVTQATIFNSDVTVENDLTVANKITATTIEVENIITTANGTPELQSDTDIILNAGTRVEVTSSPFKFASFTTAERDGISAENGDVIYNTTANKFQGYANGIWVDLH